MFLNPLPFLMLILESGYTCHTDRSTLIASPNSVEGVGVEVLFVRILNGLGYLDIGSTTKDELSIGDCAFDDGGSGYAGFGAGGGCDRRHFGKDQRIENRSAVSRSNFTYKRTFLFELSPARLLPQH